MRFLTDRKRAEGRGAAGSGTAHHWHMQISAFGLALVVPAFLYVFGSSLGKTHAEVLDIFSRPFPAVVTALVLVVGMIHFRKGAQTMIEDYSDGITRKVLIMSVAAFSYALIATGLFALAKIAL
ncbi:succinate dehydrogenase, hydrophobic membrane anchor protein [Pontibaca salina]|uniref:Succinate dehydrogenase hydrophobic membrane anchor subunit n=1 Tax=Pontibaca salina TaxID=2795731 RepID=A0A934HR67_9RHOB|nr:succinate dehydrogenase, hydrophobic membrane anchor protein [Pontibaca salina]MBI6628703.1 succinate dehydrogenase, hydrophobic membrane anchor protein [Pontibaca salina]